MAVTGFIGSGRQTFLQMIQGIGATASLDFCLDAAAAASYTSGQTWADLTASNNDFFLGVDGSSGADDPTHNGTPGDLTENEYFSVDGGDFLEKQRVIHLLNRGIRTMLFLRLLAWLCFPAGRDRICSIREERAVRQPVCVFFFPIQAQIISP